jgi:hypothetical protein
MHPTTSGKDSKETFSVENIYDLNLPEVKPGEEPLPSRAPSYKRMMAHAKILIRMGRPSAEERRAMMNPEPFRM